MENLIQNKHMAVAKEFRKCKYVSSVTFAINNYPNSTKQRTSWEDSTILASQKIIRPLRNPILYAVTKNPSGPLDS